MKIANPQRSQSSARSPVRSLQPFLGLSDLKSLQSELKHSLEEEEEDGEEDGAEAIQTSNPKRKWLVVPDL